LCGIVFEIKSVTQRPWLPGSPDITPLDLSLWGYVKRNVFRKPVNRLDDLKTRIRNAISVIPADMLHRT
jgi:hypothetical protein